MNTTEFAERRVLPVMCAVAICVIASTVLADMRMAEERAATVRLLTTMDRLDRCTADLLNKVRGGHVPEADCHHLAAAARTHHARP